jgi:putative oxidoreductase
VAVGLLTALAAAVIAATMANAVLATRSAGFWSQHGGFEYPMCLGLTAVILAVMGAGRYSFDHLLGLPTGSGWPGLVICCIAMVGSVLVMRSKRLTVRTYA